LDLGALLLREKGGKRKRAGRREGRRREKGRGMDDLTQILNWLRT